MDSVLNGSLSKSLRFTFVLYVPLCSRTMHPLYFSVSSKIFHMDAWQMHSTARRPLKMRGKMDEPPFLISSGALSTLQVS